MDIICNLISHNNSNASWFLYIHDLFIRKKLFSNLKKRNISRTWWRKIGSQHGSI
jgi:hypothetical protein